MVEEPPVELRSTDGTYPGLLESTIIVTGANNGIGRATAAVLSANGSTVYGLDIEDTPSDGGPHFDDVVAEGELVIGDVSDPEAVDTLVETATNDGNLDAVINNAGIRSVGSIADVSPTEWRRMFEVHVDGAYTVSRRALSNLQTSDRGCIVNVSSIAALGSYTESAAYSSAKAAIIGFTKQLAADYSPEGIRINAVAPGFVRTRMNEAVWKAENGGMKEDLDEQPLMQRTLVPYPGDPEDVGHLIGFLCSDAARFITGQVIPVDGGWST